MEKPTWVARGTVHTALEFASMVNKNGIASRRWLPGMVTKIARAEVRGDLLYWWADTNPPPSEIDLPDFQIDGEITINYIRTDGPLLDDFIRLKPDDPEGIARFAIRWGVFDLSQDHSRSPRFRRGSEALSTWYSHILQAQTLLRIAAQMHKGIRPTYKEWEIAAYSGPADARASAWFEAGRYDDHMMLSQLVDDWFAVYDVLPYLHWGPDFPPELLLRGVGVGAAIGVQLAIAIAIADQLVLCNGCALVYKPERRARGAERHYCLDCRKTKIPQRDAARAHRQRIKQAEANT